MRPHSPQAPTYRLRPPPPPPPASAPPRHRTSSHFFARIQLVFEGASPLFAEWITPLLIATISTGHTVVFIVTSPLKPSHRLGLVQWQSRHARSNSILECWLLGGRLLCRRQQCTLQQQFETILLFLQQSSIWNMVLCYSYARYPAGLTDRACQPMLSTRQDQYRSSQEILLFRIQERRKRRIEEDRSTSQHDARGDPPHSYFLTEQNNLIVIVACACGAMAMATHMKSYVLVLLIYLLLLAVETHASSVDENEKQRQCHRHNNQECQQMQSYPLKGKKIVLFINAANGGANWDSVNHFAGNSDWEVKELVLHNFGPIMRDDSFTAALESSYDALRQGLENIQPDVLLVSSKGVGVVTFIASKNLWVDRPVILFSPIPNPIDGLVSGESYELEWSDTINIYRKHHLGPVLVVAGSSKDEEMLISQAMQEPSACGELSQTTGRFEKCIDWLHVAVPGDHGWLRGNEAIASNLISYMMLWLERERNKETKQMK